MTRLIGVFLAVVLMSGTASPQQSQCLLRADLLKTWLEKYNEGPVRRGGSLGLDGNLYIYEVLLSSTGSWTIVRTSGDGRTCPMAFGEDWEVTGEPPVPGDPT